MKNPRLCAVLVCSWCVLLSFNLYNSYGHTFEKAQLLRDCLALLINRATIENVEIMKEEVQTMKRKTDNYESLQDKVAQLQVENEVSIQPSLYVKQESNKVSI